MTTYIFIIDGNKSAFTNMDKAAKFKTKCENNGYRLLRYGGNMFSGYYWEYATN